MLCIYCLQQFLSLNNEIKSWAIGSGFFWGVGDGFSLPLYFLVPRGCDPSLNIINALSLSLAGRIWSI